MKLLDQILGELGADTLKSFSVVPRFGGYFKSIKAVGEYSSTKIVLTQGKDKIIIEGLNLSLAKYFEQDLFIEGNILSVKIE
jgi:hypothetical protein